jgi:predicted kinase
MGCQIRRLRAAAAPAGLSWLVVAAPPSVVYLLGYPGVGKYTVAREIAQLNGAVVVDNQVVNHPILVLLEWDAVSDLPPGTLDYTVPIREAVLSALEDIAPPELSYVLTNVRDDDEESRALYERVKRVAARRAAVFLPVLLTCRREEQLRRVTVQDRVARLKIADPDKVDEYMRTTPPFVPDDPQLLRLDTTDLAPAEAATEVLRRLEEVSRAGSARPRPSQAPPASPS